MLCVVLGVQYIPYTVWSTRLKPTWEAFAEDVERYFDGTMGVAKVRKMHVLFEVNADAKAAS